MPLASPQHMFAETSGYLCDTYANFNFGAVSTKKAWLADAD